MNAIAPLVFLLAAFVLVSFAIRRVAWLVGRRRDRAVRRPHWTSVLASVLAAAVLAVQLAAVHVERARYRAAEDAVASSATRSDIETRLGLPRELAGEQVFLDGPVLSTNLVLKDEWRYNFDSPLSPFAFSHDLVIGFRPDGSIDYAYWTRFGLPPSEIPFAQSPDTPSPAEETHAESAENAEPEPHAEPAERAE